MNPVRPSAGTPPALRAVLVLVVFLQMLAGCAGGRPAPPGEDAALMEWAREGFAEEDYREVLAALQAYLPGHAGSRYTEEASLLIGRCQHELGMDIEAEDQFRRLLHDFPGGEFAPEATYYLGLSLLAQSRGPQLDQAETRDALVQFRSFTSRYPNHALVPRANEHIEFVRARLAEKEFLNGKLYYRRNMHRSARFYFEERVLKEYGDTRWAAPAKLYLAKSCEETKEWTCAATWAEDILREHADSPEVYPARGVLERARGHLASPTDAGAQESPSETSSSGPR